MPGPAPPTSLPRGPSPQISLPAERRGRRGATPSQLKVPAPSARLAPAQEAWVPAGPGQPGCPSPAPRPAPPRGQEAQSAPDSPRPGAVRRLAQGAGFLEEIRRKSAGPPASNSPPDPAGARSSAAPLAAPGGLGRGRGALGAPLPPGVGGSGAGSSEEEGPRPGGHR